MRRDPHTHPPTCRSTPHEVEHAAAHVSRLVWLTIRATVLLLGLAVSWAQPFLVVPSPQFVTQGDYQVEHTMAQVDRVKWTTTHNVVLLVIFWLSSHTFYTGIGVEYSPVVRARSKWAPNLCPVLRPPPYQRVLSDTTSAKFGKAFSSDITGDGPSSTPPDSPSDFPYYAPPLPPTCESTASPRTLRIWSSATFDEDFESRTCRLPQSQVITWAKNQLSNAPTANVHIHHRPSDSNATDGTGYCGLIALAQAALTFRHPLKKVPAFHVLNRLTLPRIRQALAPLRPHLCDASSPLAGATDFHFIWDQLHGVDPPELDAELYLPSDQFLNGAIAMGLPITLWVSNPYILGTDSQWLILSEILRDGQISSPGTFTPSSLPDLLDPAHSVHVAQISDHYYILSHITRRLIQRVVASYLEAVNTLEPDEDLCPTVPPSSLLPAPPPPPTTMKRTHTRSPAALLARRKKANEANRSRMRERAHRLFHLQLAERTAPNHTISPPLRIDLASPHASRPRRLASLINFAEFEFPIAYYQRFAGGDTRIEVLYGSERMNITGDPDELGAFATYNGLDPGDVIIFPYLGTLHDTPRSGRWSLQLPHSISQGKCLYLDSSQCRRDIGYKYFLPEHRSKKMAAPLALGPAINTLTPEQQKHFSFNCTFLPYHPAPDSLGRHRDPPPTVQLIQVTAPVVPHGELFIDYGDSHQIDPTLPPPPGYPDLTPSAPSSRPPPSQDHAPRKKKRHRGSRGRGQPRPVTTTAGSTPVPPVPSTGKAFSSDVTGDGPSKRHKHKSDPRQPSLSAFFAAQARPPSPTPSLSSPILAYAHPNPFDVLAPDVQDDAPPRRSVRAPAFHTRPRFSVEEAPRTQSPFQQLVTHRWSVLSSNRRVAIALTPQSIDRLTLELSSPIEQSAGTIETTLQTIAQQSLMTIALAPDPSDYSFNPMAGICPMAALSQLRFSAQHDTQAYPSLNLSTPSHIAHIRSTITATRGALLHSPTPRKNAALSAALDPIAKALTSLPVRSLPESQFMHHDSFVHAATLLRIPFALWTTHPELHEVNE